MQIQGGKKAINHKYTLHQFNIYYAAHFSFSEKISNFIKILVKRSFA